MKNTLKTMTIAIVASVTLTSCYSYTSAVGKGAQGTAKVSKWNHYILEGLVPVSVSDSKKMADGAENYTINTKQTFLNGLISAVTFGIYTPTTTTITK
ncbi:Bor protein [Chryseobacterium sp. RU37D]|uniref:Bor family protein n=1 Tax=Chryseobacterium sp. RU37D TaxID=1907397 RepID=UPI000954CFCB|nr:Bor family protein [Chryseobacterium sp. RU37D]SIQ61396.1 Bor protein [Chryseobacterium sp. RU37D]